LKEIFYSFVEEMMKKRMLPLTIILVLAMLLVVPASAAPPTAVQGDIIPLGLHNGVLTGAFDGTYSVFDSHGRVSLLLFEGSVNGIAGTLVLNHVDVGPNTLGYWTILEGTGDLSNLHGQGTFWFSSPVTASYDGQVHFDP
jgi:hypothetical protein